MKHSPHWVSYDTGCVDDRTPSQDPENPWMGGEYSEHEDADGLISRSVCVAYNYPPCPLRLDRKQIAMHRGAGSTIRTVPPPWDIPDIPHGWNGVCCTYTTCIEGISPTECSEEYGGDWNIETQGRCLASGLPCGLPGDPCWAFLPTTRERTCCTSEGERCEKLICTCPPFDGDPTDSSAGGDWCRECDELCDTVFSACIDDLSCSNGCVRDPNRSLVDPLENMSPCDVEIGLRLSEGYGPGGQGPMPPMVIGFTECFGGEQGIDIESNYITEITDCGGKNMQVHTVNVGMLAHSAAMNASCSSSGAEPNTDEPTVPTSPESPCDFQCRGDCHGIDGLEPMEESDHSGSIGICSCESCEGELSVLATPRECQARMTGYNWTNVSQGGIPFGDQYSECTTSSFCTWTPMDDVCTFGKPSLGGCVNCCYPKELRCTDI
jgi:hypothetical protein